MMPVEEYTGKDGTPLIYLSDAEFNKEVEMYLEQVPQSEWPRYLQKDAQYMYRLTGIGYYPNGMATAEGTIYLRWRARGDADLLAHEYGHILGHDHVEGPSTMNAVSQMRFTDPLDLKEKAKQNFPEAWRNHIVPHEAYRNTLVGGLGLMAAWAWLG